MKRSLTSFIITIIAIIPIQAQWQIENADTTRNGHYFTTNPVGTDLVYGFGSDMLLFDLATNQWQLQEDYQTGIEFRERQIPVTLEKPGDHQSVFFTSASTGFIADKNRILKTTDAGAQWEVVLSLQRRNNFLVNPYFTDIYFPSSQVGYAVGTYEKIFKTTDGGDTWQELQWSSENAPWRRLSKVVFRNENEGFVIGYQSEGITVNLGAFSHYIQKTTDGGQTWSETRLLPFPGESDHHFALFNVVDNNTLYLALVNRNYVFPFDKLLVSQDDGESWSEITRSNVAGAGMNLVIRGMHWFDDTEGILLASSAFLGRPNSIFRTTNGGNNWDEIVLPDWPHIGISSFGHVNSLSMTFQGDRGIITGAGGALYYSNDRGVSWTAARAPSPNLNAITMLSNEQGYAAGDDGLLLKKEAGTWSMLHPPTNAQGFIDGYRKLAFSNINQGALVGFSQDVYRTNNQGDQWINTLNNNDTLAIDVGFVDQTLYVLATQRATNRVLLLQQTNLNENWISATIDPDNNLFGPTGQLQLLDQNTFFAASRNSIYRSNDAGNTWAPLNTRSFNVINHKFYFISSEVGFLVNSVPDVLKDEIWKTTDGGQNWQITQLSEAIGNLGDYGVNGFIQTENGHLFAVAQVFSAGEGAIQQGRSICFVSIDQGENWDILEIPFNQETTVFGIQGWEVVENTLYLAATNGVVYTFQADGTLPIPTALPNDPVGSSVRIFPNPFEGNIQVKHPFKVVTLEILDLYGRVIATYPRVATQQAVDLSHLPYTGLYFLKVTTGNTLQTFRIIKTP